MFYKIHFLRLFLFFKMYFGKELFNQLTEAGVISDWREPNAIRMAPVPLYNSFTDVFKFGEILTKALKN